MCTDCVECSKQFIIACIIEEGVNDTLDSLGFVWYQRADISCRDQLGRCTKSNWLMSVGRILRLGREW